MLALAGRKSGRRLKRDLKLPVKQVCEAGWMLEQKNMTVDNWGEEGEQEREGEGEREQKKKQTAG